jgi:hypothetical protein
MASSATSSRDVLAEVTLKLATDESMRMQLLEGQVEDLLPALDLGEAPEVEGYIKCEITCTVTCTYTCC